MGIIKCIDVDKYFGENKVLDNLNFTLDQGDVVSIIGPSGSGKSTLLRTLIQLEAANSGQIIIEGTPIYDNEKQIDKKEKRKVMLKMGMIFQSFNLFPHKTVLGNICEPLILVRKKKKSEAVKIAQDLLNKVSLTDKGNSYPGELSGGQKQRVAIARALALDPDIILFDEPTSALDPELVGEVLNVIKELADGKITMLIVSHQMGFVKEISDKIIFMDKGKIIEVNTAENMFNGSANERIKEFLSSIQEY